MEKQELKDIIREVLLDVLANEKVTWRDEQTLLNVQEAAAFLNLAVATIYEKTSERTLPHYKHGKKLMFKKSELLAWVESRKVKSIQEIRKESLMRFNHRSKM